jgi:hypothetical protein
MKKIILLFGLVFSLCSVAQRPIYKCQFSDSIGIIDYKHVVNSIRKSLEEKNLPPEVIDKYIVDNFSNPSTLAFVQERIVDAYADSSIISMNYDSIANNRIVLEMPGNKMMVKNGVVFRYNQGLETYTLSKISDRSQVFIPTGHKFEISGFICDEYISLDSIYKIWVTEKLPSTINPGIGIKNLNKAILGFEARTGNAYTRGMLKKIEKLKS